MDKKRLVKSMPVDDLKGFEEFIDGQSPDTDFMNRGNAIKKEVSFEHFTFLVNDATRLSKMKNLLMDKIPFATRFEQGDHLVQDQMKEVILLKRHLFEQLNKPVSPYRRSLAEIFNNFFEPPKN